SADKEAIQTLVSLGYDWKSYPKYLEKIGKFLNKKEGKVLSKTHPPMQKRVLKIQQAIQLGDLNNQGGKKKAKRFYENVKS
ncbi:MAG: putative Zn-dependent protease, partial [bacterium]